MTVAMSSERIEYGKGEHAHKANGTHGDSRVPPASGKAVGKGRARRERLASGTEPLLTTGGREHTRRREEPLHTTATAEQIEITPNGT